ncbi:MAG TPA: NADH-quinone oxidoreductase subunit M [Candidatus Dormibacteraeota bacterium]|nr:NADH-quinone oxidoreductase subunit M [Candidatus Dormibacteraeota bacterium]
MLAWTIYISFIGVGILMLLPRDDAAMARKVALLTAVIGFGFALGGFFQAKAGEVLTIAKVPWLPGLGIDYHLAADGISLTLVLLTGLAAIGGILFSWNIELRAKEFFAFYLALIGGVYGVFLSFDVFLLFVFYELAIIPKYFLIAIWGSTRREYGAMKLALYSFIGSAMVLIGIIAAYVISGAKTMNLFELAKYPFPESFQMWAFPLVFVGFAILAGMWPFHTWAPTGHVAAPTAASMLLAGVVMKLGAYGCLRVAMTLFPHGLDPWQVQSYCPGLLNSLSTHSVIENIQWLLSLVGLESWRDVFSLLAVIGIVYGAMVALVQKDFKFVIGYSSVSHMGFVLLGLMTLSTIGVSGAVLQMFSHGVIAGLLFAVVGRMVYDRAHTRELAALHQMNLSRALPFAAVTFTIAGIASMGLPGFSGFVAELQVLIGAWQAFPTMAVIAGLGILIGVAYTLRALQLAFFADQEPAATAPAGNGTSHSHFETISVPERVGAVILIGASLVIGLCPRLLLDHISPSFDSPLFDGLKKIGGFMP